jgi:hypothetical protein
MQLRDLRAPVIDLVSRRVNLAAERRLRSNGTLWSLLQSYLAKTSSTGCEYSNYDALYREVRRRAPREVLECGTGVSTVVIAQALRENAKEKGIAGRVTSMEDLPPWFEMAQRLLPEELRDFTDLRLSPKVEDGYSIFRGVRYEAVPDRGYEFAFIDGPGTMASDGTRCFDFDFVHLVRHSDRPVAGIVDARLTTCYVLQQIFGTEKVRFSVFEGLGYVDPVTRHDMRDLKKPTGDLRLFTPSRFALRMESAPSTRHGGRST